MSKSLGAFRVAAAGLHRARGRGRATALLSAALLQCGQAIADGALQPLQFLGEAPKHLGGIVIGALANGLRLSLGLIENPLGLLLGLNAQDMLRKQPGRILAGAGDDLRRFLLRQRDGFVPLLHLALGLPNLLRDGYAHLIEDIERPALVDQDGR